MCEYCNVKEKPTLRLRLISLGFRIKINYRVFRYRTSKKYADAFDAQHFAPKTTAIADWAEANGFKFAPVQVNEPSCIDTLFGGPDKENP